MAVCLYRNGEMIHVEPKRLQSHFADGWALDAHGKLPTPARDETSPEAEEQILHDMGIIPTIDNVIIGATCVPV